MFDLTLNESQKIATTHNKGPMMVLSGPGSGKTTVITYRIKYLIENFDVLPKDILVITFTKSASEEMKNRFLSISEYSSQVSFATFHSYFYRIIRTHYKYELNDILGEDEKFKILKQIIQELKLPFDNEEEFVKNIMNEIALLKNELLSPIFFNSSIVNDYTFFDIFNKYEDFKSINKKIDFDDMLVKCYKLLKSDENIKNFWKNRYRYILIDEFQDINKVQYECIKLLVSDENNIFVVGDDDQSIYGFRGSRPDFLLQFPKDFKNTKKTILNTNYRSTDEIIHLCNTIIQDNKNRYEKDIVGTGSSFKSPTLLRNYDTQEESKKVVEKIQILKKEYPLEQIAIIYRTNLQARSIVESLMDYNIDYQMRDKIPSIYEHFVAKDIISYLKLSLDNLDNLSFIRIANKPKRYLNKVNIITASEICKDEKSILEYLYCNNELKTWQIEKLEDLILHLKLIKSKSAYDAIKYIMNNIGYAEYIEEYSLFKKIKSDNLFEIANEILESSKGYNNIQDYLSHISNISEELKNSFKKNKGENSKGVVLTTMHSSKGLEFDVVFVISCIDGIIPHEKSKSNTAIEEERRLFYVALTRAKKLLFISILKTKHENIVKPSRFLNKFIKKR